MCSAQSTSRSTSRSTSLLRNTDRLGTTGPEVTGRNSYNSDQIYSTVPSNALCSNTATPELAEHAAVSIAASSCAAVSIIKLRNPHINQAMALTAGKAPHSSTSARMINSNDTENSTTYGFPTGSVTGRVGLEGMGAEGSCACPAEEKQEEEEQVAEDDIDIDS